jgi:hypothetical protein
MKTWCVSQYNTVYQNALPYLLKWQNIGNIVELLETLFPFRNSKIAMNSALTILTFKQGRRGWTLVNSMPILKHQFMFDKPCMEICTLTGIVERIK